MTSHVHTDPEQNSVAQAGSPPDPIVALVRCPSYKESADAVARLFEMLELGDLFSGRDALLKVNLMKGGPGEEATNTHPEVASALAHQIARAGGSSWVGDSSGVPGFTDECFDAAGYGGEHFPRRTNFDTGPFVPLDFGGRLLAEAPVHTSVNEARCRVSVAKLKTHTLTLFSGSLKNQFGVLPGSVKPALHRDLCRTPSSLAQVIVDLNRGLPFHLGVMDGVIGREGGGTTTGQPRSAGFLAASRDLVALDAVSCHLIGISPSEVETLRMAEEQGLGTSSLRHICLMGDPPDQLYTEFARPGFEWKRFGPLARLAYGLRASAISPVVDAAKCEGCEECVKVCPADAIDFSGVAAINQRKCIRCYACHHRCPADAIGLKCRKMLQPAFRNRARCLDLSKLGVKRKT